MKKFLSLILAFVMIAFTFTACNKSPKGSETLQPSDVGLVTLADKTPKEAYDAAVAKINSMTVYDVEIKSAYTTSYLENSATTNVIEKYVTDGTTYFFSKEDDAGSSIKMWHINGVAYSSQGEFNERLDISLDDYKYNYFISGSGLIFSIDESAFTDVKFIQEDENYVLNLTITPENYYKIAFDSISENAICKIVFDSQANILSFGIVARTTRPESGYNLELDRKVEFKSIDSNVTVSLPENLDSFRVAPKMTELDMTSIETVENLVETDEKTDLVKLEIANYGTIVIRLYSNVAPVTVDNFKNLVSQKFYDGLIFHRVVKNMLMQGGDPEGNGMGGSGKNIKGEFLYNGFTNNLSHKRGVVSMARSEMYNSASSQFFIVQSDYLNWDGQYAAFGYVVYGMDVVDTITALDVDVQSKPLSEVKITSARFVKVSE